MEGARRDSPSCQQAKRPPSGPSRRMQHPQMRACARGSAAGRRRRPKGGRRARLRRGRFRSGPARRRGRTSPRWRAWMGRRRRRGCLCESGARQYATRLVGGSARLTGHERSEHVRPRPMQRSPRVLVRRKLGEDLVQRVDGLPAALHRVLARADVDRRGGVPRQAGETGCGAQVEEVGEHAASRTRSVSHLTPSRSEDDRERTS